MVGTATALGRARGKVQTAIKGLAWTEEQEAELQWAVKRVVAEREAFIAVARAELGAAAVVLPLEARSLAGIREANGRGGDGD